jgi:hypothetical protein
MTTQDRISMLAQWLGSVLTEGVVLSRTVEDYVSGTFGCCDLSHILDTADSSEIDSLLELLFYPDIEMRVRYETRWGWERFDRQALEAVIEHMGVTPMSATITHPGVGGSVQIELPPFVIEAFVRRLNIAWRPTPGLQRCLNQNSRHQHIVRMCVHLRHARVQWHAGQVRLIERFMAKMPETATELETDLLFLLDILPEFTPMGDAFDFLAAKKHFFFQALCKAEDFERKRKTSNMEIMMLQGRRAAHGSIWQWRRQMQQIDRICRALYGRTQFFQSSDARSINLAEGKTANHIQDVIRQLS